MPCVGLVRIEEYKVSPRIGQTDKRGSRFTTDGIARNSIELFEKPFKFVFDTTSKKISSDLSKV